MKKLIFPFLFALLTPLTVYAISFNELTNNPSQFNNVHESKDSTYYIDNYSIQTIRYAPPYYTMKAQEYVVDYNYQMIMQSDIFINFDYGRSSKNLLLKLRHDYPTMPSSKLAGIFIAELNKNSGIISNTNNILLYKFNGEFAGKHQPDYNQKVPINTPLGSIANYMFYKGYNIYFFDPSLVKRE